MPGKGSQLSMQLKMAADLGGNRSLQIVDETKNYPIKPGKRQFMSSLSTSQNPLENQNNHQVTAAVQPRRSSLINQSSLVRVGQNMDSTE